MPTNFSKMTDFELWEYVILHPMAGGRGPKKMWSGVRKSFSGGKSEPIIDPSLISAEQRQDILGQLIPEGRGAPPPNVAGLNFGMAQSAYRDPLQSAILNKADYSPAEQDFLDQIMQRVSGFNAMRGLGESPLVGGQIAQNIAPSMIDFRQRQITNLANALGQNMEENASIQANMLNQRGQDIGQRESDMNFMIARQNALNNLLAGTRAQSLGSKERGPGLGYGLTTSFFGGLGEGLGRRVSNIGNKGTKTPTGGLRPG